MFTKKDVEEICKELNTYEVMNVYYKGFTGRGINGVQAKCVRIKDHKSENTLINSIEYQKKYIQNLEFKENYFKVSFILKNEKKNSTEEYSVLVPYDGITSIEIVKL